jgi:HlyD family secretion protein
VVTYDVVVDVENPDLRLLPGMTAYVDIELYREDNALLAPNAALNYRPGGGPAPVPGADASAGTGAAGSGQGGRDGGAAAGPAGGGAPPGQGEPGGGGAPEAAQGPGGQDGPTGGAGGDVKAEIDTTGLSSPDASEVSVASLVIPSKDDPPGHAMVYVLDREGKPKAVEILTGATDLRFTVVRGGPLKAGDQVIISESAATEPAQGTLFGGGRGSASRPGGGPRPF